ncbi:carboxyltransferase domain-containing protein, partial [Klebsiella pneumoniae]|nr:carboxyltransferase domain-containing protein [Klebsiella pneumoniae]
AALTSPIVLETGADRERLVARVSGDTHLLLEIGPTELDLALRFRGHALMQSLEAMALTGVGDLTPGIRSLQIHYQPESLPLAQLLAIVERAWQDVLLQKNLRVPSR